MRRLTETEKWQDPWFRGLSPEQKLAWLYLIDSCDCAGFIELDRALANFQIGFDVDWDSFTASCPTRVMKLASGKIFVMHFVEFQCKTRALNLANNAHLGIFRCFEKHGINPEEFGLSFVGEPRGYFGAKKGLSSPTGKGIGKGKGNKGESEGDVGRRKYDPLTADLPFTSGRFRDSWSDWVTHRREIRKPLTQTSVKSQLKKMREWGESRAVAAMQHTIASGWTGLREPEGAEKRAKTQYTVLKPEDIL